MPQPWKAEREITPDFVRGRVERAFPELAPVQAERLSEGWDNAVFLVNGEFAFRFPRRRIAVPLLERELRLLPRLADRLPLPIPVPRFAGRPDADDPWPFYGHRLLPGRTMLDRQLDDARRRRLAAPLARFLRALHSTPVDVGLEAGLSEDEFGRLDVHRRGPDVIDRLSKLAPHAGILDPAPYRAIIEAALDASAPPPCAVVHGDLHGNNVLVDEEGRPSGVIDWGDVHIGHPALDLTIAFAFPPEAQDAFWQAYGPVEGATWRLARFRAVHLACVELEYALDTGSAALVAEAKRLFAYAVAARRPNA